MVGASVGSPDPSSSKSAISVSSSPARPLRHLSMRRWHRWICLQPEARNRHRFSSFRHLTKWGGVGRVGRGLLVVGSVAGSVVGGASVLPDPSSTSQLVSSNSVSLTARPIAKSNTSAATFILANNHDVRTELNSPC